MVRHTPERVLIIGDSQRQLQSAVAQALPNAHITSVATVFDGIGELSINSYTTILAAAEPIERRPEPAVRMLRQLAGDGRLVLFGHPTLEILSKKMLQFGCDDYIITPANGTELEELFNGTPFRLSPPALVESPALAEAPVDASVEESSVEARLPDTRRPDGETPAESPSEVESETESFSLNPPSILPREEEPIEEVMATATAPAAPAALPPAPPAALPELPFADIFLDAMLRFPNEAPQAAVRMLNERLSPHVELRYTLPDDKPLATPEDRHVFSHAVWPGKERLGTLHLLAVSGDDHSDLEPILAQLAHLVGKLAALTDRHSRLQKLSITDDLTGLYNARYFRHFLNRLVERAKKERFNVTLLLFDIDDFKKYNDAYGHGAGDEILKQTAKLMQRCCREHDLVARIGGDEFAVVFWDKDGPRQPLDATRPVAFPRPPQTPVQMFERFKRLAASSDFAGLGQSGRGRLSVSGGLAVYPFDATDVPTLIKAADDYLMFKAKKAGKNSVYLVEGAENGRKPM